MNETTKRPFLVPFLQYNRQYSPQGILQSESVVDQRRLFSADWSRQGVSLPNYRSLIKNGQNATTPFTGIKREGTTITGTVFSRRPNGGTGPFESLTTGAYISGSGFPDPYSGSITTADNLALKGIYKKIRETRTQFQGGVFLGELRETIRMLKSPAKSLVEGITSYLDTTRKRLSRSKRKNFRQVISDSWLEYSFGWVPAVNDISEALKAIRKIGETDSRSTLSSTGEQERMVNLYWGFPTTFGTDHPAMLEIWSREYVSVQYKVGMRVTVQALSAPREFERFGFVKSQLVPTLWELTPWSFLLDYITNIGDIVDATATETSDVMWVCKTVRTSVSNIYTLALDTKQFYTDFPINSHIEGTPGSTVMTTTSINRSSYLSLPRPRFAFEVPGRPSQWLNMGALVGARKSLTSFLNRN